jgi:hypothetical protein
MDCDTVTRVPRHKHEWQQHGDAEFCECGATRDSARLRQKASTDTMRDSLIELLTLLEVLGSWDRFKRGYRPANDKLHDVIEKIKKVI